jgi:hypothetical protein
MLKVPDYKYLLNMNLTERVFTASPFHLQIIAGDKGYLRLSDQNSLQNVNKILKISKNLFLNRRFDT